MIGNLFNATAKSYRKDRTARTATGEVPSAETAIASFRCRLDEKERDSETMEAGLDDRPIGRLYAGAQIDLAIDDSVVVMGRRWRVTSLRRPAGLRHHLEAGLIEVLP